MPPVVYQMLTNKDRTCSFTSINHNVYDTSNERVSNYEDECRKHIVHDAVLPKWNMLSTGRVMTNRTKYFLTITKHP